MVLGVRWRNDSLEGKGLRKREGKRGGIEDKGVGVLDYITALKSPLSFPGSPSQALNLRSSSYKYDEFGGYGHLSHLFLFTPLPLLLDISTGAILSDGSWHPLVQPKRTEFDSNFVFSEKLSSCQAIWTKTMPLSQRRKRSLI